MKKKRVNSEQTTLLALSEFEPMSHREYAELVGISYNLAHQRMQALYNNHCIHIAKYEQNEVGPPTPFYSIGRATDAVRPEPMTRKEINRKYRHSDHGKKVARLAGRRWRRSKRGQEVLKSYAKTRYIKRKLENGSIEKKSMISILLR